MKNSHLVLATLCGGAFAVASTLAVAQSNQNARTTARIISDLEFNDNYDLRANSLGNAAIWTTTFGASLNDRTETDTLFLDAQGSARVSDLPSIGTDILADDPRVQLNYNRLVDDNSLSFSADYRRADIDFFDPLSDLNPDGSFDDTRSGGTREVARARFAALINQNGPVNFDFSASYYNKNYFDTVDPSLDDQEISDVSGEFGFRLSPILRATFGGRYAYEKLRDATDKRETTAVVDVGLDATVNQRTTAVFRIGYSNVDTERTTGTVRQEGVVGSLDFVIDQINGQVRAGARTIVDENGERATISLGKLWLMRNGLLDFDLGVSASDNTNIRAVGNVDYEYRLPRSSVRLGLRQGTTTNNNGDDVINTSGSIAFTQQITNISSVNMTLIGGLQRVEGNSDEDTDRITFTATYRRSITPDWSMNLGYRHRLRDSENQNRANSNAVFFGVRRDFASLR